MSQTIRKVMNIDSKSKSYSTKKKSQKNLKTNVKTRHLLLAFIGSLSFFFFLGNYFSKALAFSYVLFFVAAVFLIFLYIFKNYAFWKERPTPSLFDTIIGLFSIYLLVFFVGIHLGFLSYNLVFLLFAIFLLLPLGLDLNKQRKENSDPKNKVLK